MSLLKLGKFFLQCMFGFLLYLPIFTFLSWFLGRVVYLAKALVSLGMHQMYTNIFYRRTCQNFIVH